MGVVFLYYFTGNPTSIMHVGDMIRVDRYGINGVNSCYRMKYGDGEGAVIE